MQQPPMMSPTRVYLPHGSRTWKRVLLGVIAPIYLLSVVFEDVLWLRPPLGPRVTLLVVLVLVTNLAQLVLLLTLVDAAIRVAFLDGTVMVVRTIFGIRRCDLASAPAIGLERKALGIVRLSAYDPSRGRWVRVGLRPSKARVSAGWHPLAVLADAILAGQPRPEPAGREAWFVAQQLRQLASHQMARAA